MEAFYLEQRILDIRRRIEQQRARIGYTQARPRTTQSNEQVLAETSSVEKARAAKNAELDALKAKLMPNRK